MLGITAAAAGIFAWGWIGQLQMSLTLINVTPKSAVVEKKKKIAEAFALWFERNNTEGEGLVQPVENLCFLIIKKRVCITMQSFHLSPPRRKLSYKKKEITFIVKAPERIDF